MCAYNAENTVAEAIESVLNQTMPDFEFIFVNDGSTDKTLQIASFYAQKDNRMQIIDQKNTGAGQARNHGIKKSSGNYIAFLDSDDVWLKQKLELQSHVIEENDKVDIVVTDMISYDELQQGLLTPNYNADYYPDFFERLVNRNFFFQPMTSLIKKELFELALFTDDHSGEDYYPFLVFALHNAKLFKLNCPLYGERELLGSLQRSKHSGFISGLARHNAIQSVMDDEIHSNYLTEDRIILLKNASDKFLTWASSGSRHYMNYIDSFKFTIKLYPKFYKKRFYFIELLKNIFFSFKF
jgi:glycosyltransferase involved in cell wall biosynthesis